MEGMKEGWFPGSHEVEGSNPSRSTNVVNRLQPKFDLFVGCVEVAGLCRLPPVYLVESDWKTTTVLSPLRTPDDVATTDEAVWGTEKYGEETEPTTSSPSHQAPRKSTLFPVLNVPFLKVRLGKTKATTIPYNVGLNLSN
jgi:hypothetical protein